ncbi:BioY protein [Syntrophomonas zehnderi OL-4]|uniref:Biotin transporter n=1 Tax=Syntrophomonas zehnderi OL-4 TaxID=690567 RepID=A0A0E4C969_9FIRM|nr:biotin transporter BioY [Syntrophomonas zehnderi]CFX85242.1 BioY protein [Syntrophomonas zehnderi OL-4]
MNQTTRSHSQLRRMVYAAMFGALTAIGSLIVIPMQPVPITLQTLFTSLAGVLLGGSAAALSQVVYVLLGIIGLPVFAGGKAGLGILFGPTGGYLIGFIVGAYIIGKITEARQEPSLVWITMALVVGNLVIYTVGVTQLSLVAHLSVIKALLVGVVPFLFGDLIKLVAAVLIAFKLRNTFKL